MFHDIVYLSTILTMTERPLCLRSAQVPQAKPVSQSEDPTAAK
jgi:hypothetical protein